MLAAGLTAAPLIPASAPVLHHIRPLRRSGKTQKYTIFGQAVRGQDVVDAISKAPLHGDMPVEPAKATQRYDRAVEESSKPLQALRG